ncbi:hypothetical protein INT44_004879 [Umbelopsis vinacea]|uniref:PH domain-containing protein n=1 Tax=Umbelopsis vinacea TaxID=44442 RepID=A0A8H7UMI4_9FUNG|nr:hypothetical protein INT44_004879 [Umbelopsis vinacea]
MTSVPTSILKLTNQPVRQPLSEDDDDEDILHHNTLSNARGYTSADDLEEDEDNLPVESADLLQLEKVIKAGYLLKKGEKRRTWKRRWFVLRATKMALYKDDKEYRLLRIIDMHDVHSTTEVKLKDKHKWVIGVVTPKRTFYLQAPSEHALNEWMLAFQQAKEEFKLLEHDDSNSSLTRDEEAAKELVSSYSTGTSPKPFSPLHNARRESQHSISSVLAASQEVVVSPRTRIPPLDIPGRRIPPPGVQDYLSTSISTTTSAGSPLSPINEQVARMHLGEDAMSSEDEDYRYDESTHSTVAAVEKEGDKNRVLFEGYLLKLGRNKSWRKRWFVLRSETLAYYENEKEYAPHRILPLSDVLDSLEIDPVSKNKRFVFKIVTVKRNFILCADQLDTMERWLDTLSVAVRRAKKVEQDVTRPVDNASGISGAGGVGGAGGALGGQPSNSGTRQVLSKSTAPGVGC